MVLLLDHDQRVARQVLVGHIPWRGGGTGAAADTDARPLAKVYIESPRCSPIT